jgi:hypothetical protein
MYAYGCRPIASVGKKRSGLKVNGSGNNLGFRCAAKDKTPIVLPAGIKYFPGIYPQSQGRKNLYKSNILWIYQFEHLLGQPFQIQERWDTTATFL